MMIAVDNKLPQPPNSAWQDIATVPLDQQVALTDATKTYAWIGYVAAGSTPPPLKAGGSVSADQQPAFWSNLGDQA